MTDKVNAELSKFFKSIDSYNSKERTGGVIILFKDIDGVRFIEHQPKNFTFIRPEEIVVIEKKEYLRSDYITPILERIYLTIFELPRDNRN